VLNIRWEAVPENMRSYHASTLRWILYKDLLSEHEGYKMIYNRVWLLDVRDTYFQLDPFSFIAYSDTSPSSLHVFHGVESVSLGQCGWNSGWVRDCFGDTVLNRMKNVPILCSGTVAGTMDFIAEYIEVMGSVVLGANLQEDYTLTREAAQRMELLQRITGTGSIRFPHCERNGVDQGVHNVLFHNHIFDNNNNNHNNNNNNNQGDNGDADREIIIHDQRSGPVMNMQAKLAQIRSGHSSGHSNSNSGNGGNGEGQLPRVYNSRGDLVHVVHQYDRDTNFQQALFVQVNTILYYILYSAIQYYSNYTITMTMHSDDLL
jgi:hypothetical protein